MLCKQITRGRVDFNRDSAEKSPRWSHVWNLSPSLFALQRHKICSFLWLQIFYSLELAIYVISTFCGVFQITLQRQFLNLIGFAPVSFWCTAILPIRHKCSYITCPQTKKCQELNLGPSGSQSYKLLTSLYLQDCDLKSFLKSLVPVTSEVQFNLLLLISKSISHLKVKASVSGLNLKTVVTLSDFQKPCFYKLVNFS